MRGDDKRVLIKEAEELEREVSSQELLHRFLTKMSKENLLYVLDEVAKNGGN